MLSVPTDTVSGPPREGAANEARPDAEGASGGAGGTESALRQDVVLVERRAPVRLVLVEATGVALEAAVDAVRRQCVQRGRVPGVVDVVVEGVAAPAREADVGH